MDLINIAKKKWDNLVNDEFKSQCIKKQWSNLPQIAANHNFLITGDRNYYWIDWLKDHYFINGFAGDTLSLGCGEGGVDRVLKERGFSFSSITGIDLSKKCTDTAQKLAEEIKIAPKIEYFNVDLNKYEVSKNSYDFIYFFHSLHHIEALEHLLASCSLGLKPNGILMVNEFVGPSQFQWTDKQINMANKLLSLLPEDLKFDSELNKIKTKIKKMNIEEMKIDDPSEAVQSSEIPSVLKKYFDIIEEKNWGGTLNNLILANIAENFDPKNSYHNSIADLLIYHENILIENKIIPSDFKFYVAKSKN